MKIHWDRDTWTDQHLLEKRLRLPATITGQVATAAPSEQGLDVSRGAGGQVPGHAVEGRPMLILFTNRYCIGCEEVKRVVLSDPIVQAAISDWDYRAVDTAEPAAAALAARHRVSVTPVLVAFDRQGRELLRSEDIETSAKLLAVIAEARSKGKSGG
jgi:thiol:disulfide interchange protein